MYPEHLLFGHYDSDSKKEKFWFQEGTHFPDPRRPFDTIMSEATQMGIGYVNAKLLKMPGINTQEHRIFNGRVYVSPLNIDLNNSNISVKLFEKKLRSIYKNWDVHIKKWEVRVKHVISTLKTVEFPHPNDEINWGLNLLENYWLVQKLLFEAWSLHFELLIPGYIAYFRFSDFCTHLFPGISKTAISMMLSGVNTILFKPDRILHDLAYQIVINKLESSLEFNSFDQASIFFNKTQKGRDWLVLFNKKSNPWFYFSSGSGFNSNDSCWIDDLNIPWAKVKHYAKDIKASKKNTVVSTSQKKRKSKKVADGYSSLISDHSEKIKFEKALEIARNVAPHIEDHNFYVEHWFHTLFWNKIRLIGKILVHYNIVSDSEDVFFFNRFELENILSMISLCWASGAEPDFKNKKELIEERKTKIQEFEREDFPLYLGTLPNKIDDPVCKMLFGIYANTFLENKHLNNELKGIGASPGVVIGSVRIIQTIKDLSQATCDDIIVCRTLLPSWGETYQVIKGAICETGGVLSHAAIVCREYGLPAIVGVKNVLKNLGNGNLIEMNGLTGHIRIIKPNE